MRNTFLKSIPALALLAALPIAASTHHHKSSTQPSVSQHAAGMSAERATEIQTALIKQGYLSGDPTGKWDSASVAAMQKLQSENGWQTKFTPDSRALIKLGLGDSEDNEAATTATASPLAASGGR